jgi:hypothetical protein
MQGLMMDTPLLISGLLEHVAAIHGDREIGAFSPIRASPTCTRRRFDCAASCDSAASRPPGTTNSHGNCADRSRAGAEAAAGRLHPAVRQADRRRGGRRELGTTFPAAVSPSIATAALTASIGVENAAASPIVFTKTPYPRLQAPSLAADTVKHDNHSRHRILSESDLCPFPVWSKRRWNYD